MKSDSPGKRYIILFAYYFPSYIIPCVELQVLQKRHLITFCMARGPTLLNTHQVVLFS